MSGAEGFTNEEIYDAMQNGADDECYECGGEGFIEEDCFEDSCCCLEHELIPCPVCNRGTGDKVAL